MKDFIEQLGINIAISIAGLFGSLLMIGKSAAQTWKTTVFSMISGVACANYITPIILDITRMDVKYQVSVGFVLGFLGLRSVEMISKKFVRDATKPIDKSDS